MIASASSRPRENIILGLKELARGPIDVAIKYFLIAWNFEGWDDGFADASPQHRLSHDA